MLTAGSSVSEVIVIFLQVILFASTAAFFVLCSDSSRLFLRRRTPVRKISTRWYCVDEINHSCDVWLIFRKDGLQTVFSCIQRYPI